jgi:hypothetical protein
LQRLRGRRDHLHDHRLVKHLQRRHLEHLLWKLGRFEIDYPSAREVDLPTHC